jgi:hypothetical protein
MLKFPATAKTALGAGLAAMTLAAAALPGVASAQSGDPCAGANFGGGAIGAVAGASAGSNLARGGGRTGGAIIGGVIGALVGSAAARGATNCAEAPPAGYYANSAYAPPPPNGAYAPPPYGAYPPTPYGYYPEGAYYAAPPPPPPVGYYAPGYYYGPSVGLFIGGGYSNRHGRYR